MQYKAMVYLDDVSKSVIKTNISSFTAKGILFVGSFAEMTEAVLKDTRKVIFLEGIFGNENSYSDLKLFKELLGLEYYYLGSGNVYMEYMKEIAHCYRCDISTLSYEVVQSALFGDHSLESSSRSGSLLDENVSLAAKLLEDDSAGDYKVRSCLQSYVSLAGVQNEFYRKYKAEAKKNEQLLTENLYLQKSSRSLLDGYKQIIHSSYELNKSLRKYETAFSKDVYEKINLQHYSERPLIIYLKEFQEFLNLEEFIDTLYNVFKIQERKSVKVLRLFDSSGGKRILTLPPKYLTLYNQYMTKDIFVSDFLCKSGDYLGVMEHLFLNRVNLDVLIIVDCKDSYEAVVNGTTLQLNLCRESVNMQALGLMSDNTVVNYQEDGGGLLQWHAEPCRMENDDERFVYLSSRPVVKRVLEMSRQLEQSV